MKILLFGKNGQVGWELQRSLVPLGEVVALDFDQIGGDFTDMEGIVATVRRIAPDVIVNSAAYTAVDKAESEVELCHKINAQAPAVLAREARSLGAWLVHYSTDYVFDGSGDQPWNETDPVGPLNAYGISKLAGEEAVRESGCNYLLFRTSWVYAARGQNFAKTMVRLAVEKERLTVIDDQIGAPTGADFLADVTAQSLRMARVRPELAGLYHVVASGETSWFGYARFVIDFARKAGLQVKVGPEAVVPVASSAFATAARRPHNSRLNTRKFCDTFGLHMPDWQAGVARMLTEAKDKWS